MRERRYRAWDKEVEAMLFSINVNDHIQFGGEASSGNIYVCKPFYHPSLIVMDCIGLEDRNKKEIYEGDIVKFTKIYSKGYGVNEIREFIGVIKENEYCHSCIMVGTTEFHIDNLLKGEIIGDGYRNPELLKEKS